MSLRQLTNPMPARLYRGVAAGLHRLSDSFGRPQRRPASSATKPANDWRWAFRLAQPSQSEVSQQSLDRLESRDVERIAYPVAEGMAMADGDDAIPAARADARPAGESSMATADLAAYSKLFECQQVCFGRRL